MLPSRNLLCSFLHLLLTLTLAGCSKPGRKSNAQLNPRLEAIRQAGYPVTLPELNEWYATPAPSENSAPLYDEAFAALAPLEHTSPAFLTQNQKTLACLHQAASRNKCRYPIDFNEGAAMLMPHLLPLKKSAQLLAQQANSQAAKGRMDLVAQSLLDGFRLAQSLREEPLLLSLFTQLATANALQASLESALNRKAWTQEQLALLQAALRETENSISLPRALAGERCTGLAVFQMPPEEQAKLLKLGHNTPKDVDLVAYRKTATYETDLDFFLSQMEESLAVAALPFPKNLEALRDWTSRLNEGKSKGYVLSSLQLPSLESILTRTAECVAKLRAAQTALAIEQYRLSHQNSLPDSLMQLVSSQSESALLDPFDGKPIRYARLSPRGFVTYSIGKDQHDDGGCAKSAVGKSDASCDLPFAVRR